MANILECNWRYAARYSDIEFSLKGTRLNRNVAYVVENEEDYLLLKAYLMIEGAKASVYRELRDVPIYKSPLVPVH